MLDPRELMRHDATQELIDTDPLRATWAPTWCNGFIKLIVKAHEHSVHTEEDRGGVLGPLGRRKGLSPFYLLYPLFSLDCLRVGLSDSSCL